MLCSILIAAGAVPNQSALESGIVLGAIMVIVAALALVLWRRDRIRVSQIRERELAAYQDRNRVEQLQKERDGKAYAQHVALNELQTTKLALETKLLQAQFDNVERDRHMRDNHEDYHKLMMQKTELEIQNLKLHIREMRKRTEDFGSYEDE